MVGPKNGLLLSKDAGHAFDKLYFYLEVDWDTVRDASNEVGSESSCFDSSTYLAFILISTRLFSSRTIVLETYLRINSGTIPWDGTKAA